MKKNLKVHEENELLVNVVIERNNKKIIDVDIHCGHLNQDLMKKNLKIHEENELLVSVIIERNDEKIIDVDEQVEVRQITLKNMIMTQIRKTAQEGKVKKINSDEKNSITNNMNQSKSQMSITNNMKDLDLHRASLRWPVTVNTLKIRDVIDF